MPEQSSTNKVCSHHFKFFAWEVEELLQFEEFLPYSLALQDHESGERSSMEANYRDTSDCNASAESCSNGACTFLFGNGIFEEPSAFKMERLKSCICKNFSLVSQKVEEMVDPVISIVEIQSCIRRRKRLLNCSHTDGAGRAGTPLKKVKTCLSGTSHCDIGSMGKGYSGSEIEFLVDKDSSQVEEAVRKHSQELCETFKCMEDHLERILDAVSSRCRHMSPVEKRHLVNLISNLSPRNLDRVAQIIHTTALPPTLNEILIDLEKEDDAILWRLYFYTQAVTRARANLPPPS